MNRDEIITAYEATLNEMEEMETEWLEAMRELDEYRVVIAPRGLAPIKDAFVSDKERRNGLWGERITQLAYEVFESQNESAIAVQARQPELVARVNGIGARMRVLERRIHFYDSQLRSL